MVAGAEVSVMLTRRFGRTENGYWMLDAGLLETQTVREEVRMHLTKSPFTGMYVYTVELDPWFIPLTCHWYTGLAPGLTGCAVNVTEVPAQTESAEAVIVTLTESPGLTVTGKSTVGPEQLPIFGVM